MAVIAMIYATRRWQQFECYQITAITIGYVPSVYDITQGGAVLIQMFNSANKNEAQKQFMLQVIKRY